MAVLPLPETAPLVTTDWLRRHVGHPRLKPVDGSWRLDGGAETAFRDYQISHVPGAAFFDIDAIAAQDADLPHMAPSPDEFANAVGALGISNDDTVIVYDQAGLFSSARVWWTFRAMGHEAVAVLDGGLPAWRAAGGALDSGLPAITPVDYIPPAAIQGVARHEDIRAGEAAILDARPPARFAGQASEPRPGLRSGAMPGAQNVPASALVNANGRVKTAAEIRTLLKAAGVNDGPKITTCGSGVTAAIIGLALEVIGENDWRLYDGAWAEWGREGNDPAAFPVVVNS